MKKKKRNIIEIFAENGGWNLHSTKSLCELVEKKRKVQNLNRKTFQKDIALMKEFTSKEAKRISKEYK